MSLELDVFWKAGFWSTTFWADGFWDSPVEIDPAPGSWSRVVKGKRYTAKSKAELDQIIARALAKPVIVTSGIARPITPVSVPVKIKPVANDHENILMLLFMEAL